MILRRFMQHVKDQNWFAVGLELVVVIVGIFLGMQVTNWNDTRIENETAKVYIERVREDLKGNQTDLQERIAYFKTVRKAAESALKSFNGPQEELGKDFVINIFQASHLLPRELGRDTYDEILSVGALNTEMTINVRKRLAIHYRSIGAPVVNLDRSVPYRDIVRKILPYDVQVLIRTSCNDVIETKPNGEPSIRLPETCDIDIPQPLVDEAIEAILAANIKPELIHRLSLIDSIQGSMRLILSRIELLDNDLKQWRDAN